MNKFQTSKLAGKTMVKTKLGRNIASGLFYRIALDSTLAFAVVYLFAEERDFWLSFGFVLGFLFIVPVFFNVKTAVYKTLLHFVNRKSVREQLVREFRKARLPLLSHSDFNDTSDIYFAEVAQDDNQPLSARLFAGQTVGQFAILPLYSAIDAMTLYANTDAALATYFDQLRRDKSRAEPKFS